MNKKISNVHISKNYAEQNVNMGCCDFALIMNQVLDWIFPGTGCTFFADMEYIWNRGQMRLCPMKQSEAWRPGLNLITILLMVMKFPASMLHWRWS